MNILPISWTNWTASIKKFLQSKANRYKLTILVDLLCLLFIITNAIPMQNIQLLLSPTSLQPITQNKGKYEVFGFAPHWTLHKLHNIDFQVLTTLAYFDIPILSDGNLDTQGPGYESFMSKEATTLFKKAHAHGTRVVLTITQMETDEILQLMDDTDGQKRTIEQAVSLVQQRGIDGINIDVEFGYDAGEEYRKKFTSFTYKLTDEMHKKVPGSKVTVSVYASAIKAPKIYDIGDLSKKVDGIFMMAYDYGYRGSEEVMPTSPLYGHKEGKYWYDISTAVEDFIKEMPAEKLILGTAWYGYNYAIYGEPKVQAETRPAWSWRGGPKAETYSIAKNTIKPDMDGVSQYKEGWDDLGKVAWKAYYSTEADTWRMIFLDDSTSLGIKYDFAKQNNLGGVGMWALGFDEGKTELWSLLREKFGVKLADSRISEKVINENAY